MDSRIQHASSALFIEISRGYFLPFCTVALAALARIRMVLRRIGRLGVTFVQLHVDDITAVMIQLQPSPIVKGNTTIVQTVDWLEPQALDRLFRYYMDDTMVESTFSNLTSKQRAAQQRDGTLAKLGRNERSVVKHNRRPRLPNVPSNANSIPSNDTTQKDTQSSMQPTRTTIDSTNLGVKTEEGLPSSPIFPEKERPSIEDDLGERIDDGRLGLLEDATIESHGNNRDGKGASRSSDYDTMDRNMAIVDSLKPSKQQGKKSKEKQKKKRKNEELPRDLDEPKEKKKRPKADFFDALFG